MSRPPRSLNQKIFSAKNMGLAIAQGLGLMVLVAGTYMGLLQSGQSQAYATSVAYSLLVTGNWRIIAYIVCAIFAGSIPLCCFPS